MLCRATSLPRPRMNILLHPAQFCTRRTALLIYRQQALNNSNPDDALWGATSPPFYPSPWMDGSSGWAEAYAKAQEFVKQMTLLEKVNLTTGISDRHHFFVEDLAAHPSICIPDTPRMGQSPANLAINRVAATRALEEQHVDMLRGGRPPAGLTQPHLSVRIPDTRQLDGTDTYRHHFFPEDGAARPTDLSACIPEMPPLATRSPPRVLKSLPRVLKSLLPEVPAHETVEPVGREVPIELVPGPKPPEGKAMDGCPCLFAFQMSRRTYGLMAEDQIARYEQGNSPPPTDRGTRLPPPTVARLLGGEEGHKLSCPQAKPFGSSPPTEHGPESNSSPTEHGPTIMTKQAAELMKNTRDGNPCVTRSHSALWTADAGPSSRPVQPPADPALPVSYSRPINRQRGSTRSTNIAGGGALAEQAFKKLMAKVNKACKTGRAGPDQEAGWRDCVGLLLYSACSWRARRTTTTCCCCRCWTNNSNSSWQQRSHATFAGGLLVRIAAPYGGFLTWVCLQLDFWEFDLVSSDDGFHVHRRVNLLSFFTKVSSTLKVLNMGELQVCLKLVFWELDLASSDDSFRVVEWIRDWISVLPEAGLLGNESCLHLENGDNARQLTKLLITRGVDPNTRALLDLLEVSSTKKLTTPLQDAVNNHKRVRIDLLLAHGADPNMVTSADGLSPLKVALRQRSPDVVDALLRHGAAKYAVANPTNNGSFNILTHPDALEGLGRRYGCASGSS
ncbi:putative beta-glucosidase protein [Lasiodiplodia theobromae]|nr:putative beta-glucosidase protein [Lasiodiplodia theobromae]